MHGIETIRKKSIALSNFFLDTFNTTLGTINIDERHWVFRDPNGYVIELTYPTEKLNNNSYETNMKILKDWQDQKFIP